MPQNTDTDSLNIFQQLNKQKGGKPLPRVNSFINSSSSSDFPSYNFSKNKLGKAFNFASFLSDTSDENYSNNVLQNIPNFINKHKYKIILTILLLSVFIIYRNEIKKSIKSTFDKVLNIRNNNKENDREDDKSKSSSQRSSVNSRSSSLLSLQFL